MISVVLANPTFIVNFADPLTIVTFVVLTVLAVLINLFSFYEFRRWLPRIVILSLTVFSIIAYIFLLSPVFYALLILMAVAMVYFLSANATETRALVANNMKGKKSLSFHRAGKKQGEVIFDRDEVYGKVMSAVLWMSKQKMGALITFERKDSLSEEMKSGTFINAPVSAELIQTIFYPGTRLHDGAVVIRNDQIVAASVYYKPTTRPLTGKYGSRHRAAIGISEICDAVTIVVSEETGRISIAAQGELNSVTPDALMSTFQEFMSAASEPKEE